MASVSSKEIEIAIKRQLEKALPESKVRQALSKVKVFVIDLWRKQLNEGIDGNGKRIPKLSSGYRRWKQNYIQGKIKHRAKSKSKKWYKELYTTTEFRAQGVPNHNRLTGQTYAKMAVSKEKVSIKDGNIKAEFNLFINDKKRAKIMRYNERKGRNFGFALGNSNRGIKHKKQILDVFLGFLFPKATLKSGRITVK